jgi:hypothetical protein
MPRPLGAVLYARSSSEFVFKRVRDLARLLIASLILAVGWSSISWGQPNVMQFTAEPPDGNYQKFMGDIAWRIFATGEIDADADKRLAALIASKGIPQDSKLYLHSPGGNLIGGMALGRVIRENKLHTFIGQFDPDQKYVGFKPGYCYSACALAFLGGEFRYWTNGSVYGVHRFFWKEHSDKDADVAQILSAAVVEYIRSMGVDTRIFSLASEAGSSEVVTPSHETLLALNVVNDGRMPTKWTIESISREDLKLMYLKGEQETDNGTNKFMVECVAEHIMALYAIYDIGDNADEVMTWPVNWLFLDHQPIRMDNQLHSKEVANGLMNLMYRLNTSLLNAISHAKTVGVGLQKGAGAAVFSGFDSMPFADGAAKLPALVALCHPS